MPHLSYSNENVPELIWHFLYTFSDMEVSHSQFQYHRKIFHYNSKSGLSDGYNFCMSTRVLDVVDKTLWQFGWELNTYHRVWIASESRKWNVYPSFVGPAFNAFCGWFSCKWSAFISELGHSAWPTAKVRIRKLRKLMLTHWPPGDLNMILKMLS